MRKTGWLLILLAAIIGMGAIASSFISTEVVQNQYTSGLSVNGWVTVDVNGERISSKHNVFTNIGKNITRDLLAMGGTYTGMDNITTIALGNDSAVAVNWLPNTTSNRLHPAPIAECGLGIADGAPSYTHTSVGNWSVAKTFTASCGARTVNTTGLYNGTSNSYLFAGDNFTAVTLQTDDQITITWYVWVS